MSSEVFDVEAASVLEDPDRYRYLSRDELVQAIDPREQAAVLEVGSGTGFYTDDVAPFVERLVGLDLQEDMHAVYREKGVPANVELVTADVASIPFDADTFDAVYTTMTFHEIPPDGGLPEIGSVLEREGRFVVVDWSAEGTGRSGPPLAERYTVEEATTLLEEYGFTVERAAGRPETFLVVARNRAAE